MERKTFDNMNGKNITTPEEMEAFFNDIKALCKKYNLSISHEDKHGGFIIEAYKEENIEWLICASKNYD